ncbi:hypothetical protein MVES1_000175 [Malassezia vespertilionis]|nr:uncharacterized protein MVES1_000175 [Malassezia vespertilionis]WFD04851.1 hypothetical protein MVES1_000175 [Malassezia vespertilionis]
MHARSVSTAAQSGAFSIPEEPISVRHADAQTALAAADRMRTESAQQQPQVAAHAAERNVRRMRRNMLDTMSGMASTQTREGAFRPYKLRTQPLEPYQLTLSHLLAATAQLGNARTHVQKNFQPYLYGMRHEMAIIDVERATLPALRRAVQVVRGVAEHDGVILILGTRSGLQPAIRAACARLGANGFHVSTDRWVPGVLTNAPKLLAPAIQHSASRTGRDGDEAPNTTKLASQLYQPDLVIVLNVSENAHALREATQCNIPTMAIVDTNVDPRAVTYAIPANGDSVRVAELVVGVLSKAGEDGLRRRHDRVEAWDKRERSLRRRAQKSAP